MYFDHTFPYFGANCYSDIWIVFGKGDVCFKNEITGKKKRTVMCLLEWVEELDMVDKRMGIAVPRHYFGIN